MTVLGLIPARAGSERLERKNLARVGRFALWDRAFRVANECPEIDEVVVSTNIPEILDIGLPEVVERPAKLCTSTAPIEQVIAHHMRDEHDLIVLLNPTSPFRTVATVTQAVRAAWAVSGCAVTVISDPHSHLWVHVEDGLIRTLHTGLWPRSQDVRGELRMHGAAFVTRPQTIRRGRLLGEPCAAVETEWLESWDIDTLDDLRVACMLEGDASGKTDGRTASGSAVADVGPGIGSGGAEGSEQG